MHWVTLMVRALGAFVATLAGVQILLTVAGSPELSPGMLMRAATTGRSDVVATLLDVMAWMLVGLLGAAVIRGSRGAIAPLCRPGAIRSRQRTAHR